MKITKTKQIEELYNITLKHSNFGGFLVYEVYQNDICLSNGEWLMTLNDVASYLKSREEMI